MHTPGLVMVTAELHSAAELSSTRCATRQDIKKDIFDNNQEINRHVHAALS